MSAARDSKLAETVIELSRIREKLDRLTERAEVPAELAAQPPDPRAGRQPQTCAAWDALDDVEVVVAPPQPPAVPEDALRAAVASAAETGRSPVAVLAEATGLDGDALALALGAALRYPVLESAALMALAPAFDLLCLLYTSDAADE